MFRVTFSFDTLLPGAERVSPRPNRQARGATEHNAARPNPDQVRRIATLISRTPGPDARRAGLCIA